MTYNTWLNPDFGPFDPLFAPPSADVPEHLSLLHLFHADNTVAKITATVRSGDCGPFVRRLFESPDWRPHLVGTVVCIAEPDAQWLGWLWQAIDGGSWVTPQLAVAAYLTDPEFAARARSRIEARCPISEPEISDGDDRDAMTGPGDADIRSGKMAASLLALCELIADDAPWVEAARNDPAIARLLRIDGRRNGSEGIALSWLTGISTVFRRLRVRLRLQPVVTEVGLQPHPEHAKFGPFARFLQIWYSTEPGPTPSPNHLLSAEDSSKQALVEIAGIIRQGDCRPWIRALFESADYSAQVIGAFACLVKPDPESLGCLWKAIDGGTWITPQLAVVAYLTDPEFAARAQARIEARCPISPPPLEDETVHDESTGAQAAALLPAMMAASLLALCERSPALAPWAAAAREEPEIAAMLASGSIGQHLQRFTLDWLDKIGAILRDAGIRLVPRLVDSDDAAS